MKAVLIGAVLLASVSARADFSSGDLRALTDAGIRLSPEPALWPEGAIADLAAGLRALPEPLRRVPGGPLELVLHPESAPFGMGDGTAARPDWTDGGTRFHLYAVTEPAHEARALFRLQALDAPARARLWRRRAVVHAAIARWDAARRWSDRERWRSISGFGWGGPMNEYDWAFSRSRGKESAALDLATFAEELFVPADEGVAVDDTVRCQELTRSRFMQEVLAEEKAALPPRGACPAFDAWAKADAVSQFEILMANPSTAHPESVFGHLMLAIARDGEPMELFEVAAISDAQDAPTAFVLKGATGGYLATYGRATLASIRQRYVEGDQRSLRRFRLNLSAEERVRVLERIWELERRGYPRYYFFQQNCASLLLFVLAPAVDTPMPTFWAYAMPGQILDGLARRGLLTLLPQRIEADADRALREGALREARIDQVLAALSPEDRILWERYFHDAASTDARSRTRAHAQLVALIPRAASAVSPLIAQTLDGMLIEERYAADRAHQRAAAIDTARIQRAAVKPPSAEQVILRRQSLFQRELPDRGLQELHDLLAQDALWANAPRRPATPAEQTALDEAAVVQKSYSTLALALARARAQKLLPKAPSPVEPAADDAWFRLQAAPANRGLGYLRLQVGMEGGVANTSASAAPALRLRFAPLAEHLGDQRDRGFSPQTELRVMDTEASFDLHRGVPDLAELDVVAFSFRTSAREPPLLRTGLWTSAGRGVALEYRRRRGTSVRDALELRGGFYVPLAERDGRDGRVRLVGLLGQLQGRLGTARPWAVAGPRLEWLERIPLGAHGLSALRVEADGAAGLTLGQPPEYQAGLRAVAEVPFGIGGQSFLFSPWVRAAAVVSSAGTEWRTSLGLSFERL